LLTRLQSQQISGMQSYSARYKYSGIRTYFNAQNSASRWAEVWMALAPILKA